MRMIEEWLKLKVTVKEQVWNTVFMIFDVW